jgi:hypothetical protein
MPKCFLEQWLLTSSGTSCLVSTCESFAFRFHVLYCTQLKPFFCLAGSSSLHLAMNGRSFGAVVLTGGQYGSVLLRNDWRYFGFLGHTGASG